jgi:hypothetical protein
VGAAASVAIVTLLGGCAAAPTAPSVAAAPAGGAGVSGAPTPSPRPSAPLVTPGAPAHDENKSSGPARVVVTTAGGRVLVDAAVRPQGLDPDGVLAPPSGVVGWYDEPGWPLPGEPGAAILAGHVGTPSTGADAFTDLPEARAGDHVTVSYPSGRSVRFVVVRSAGVPKDQTPRDDTIWDNANPRPLLRLITCDPTTPLRSGHYAGNWVLWAEPA